MKPELLIEYELAKIDWANIAEANGPANDIPSALLELFNSQSPEEVQQAYWKLENHVVLQGQLFEAASFTVPILLAGLALSDKPRFVRIGILELLFQIVSGSPHEDEIRRGLNDIDTQCILAARLGLWSLYRELLCGEKEAALEVLEVIDKDGGRLSFIKQYIKD